MTKKTKEYDEQFKVGYCKISIQPLVQFNFNSAQLSTPGTYSLRFTIRWQNEFKNNDYNRNDWVDIDLGSNYKTEAKAMTSATEYLRKPLLKFKKERLDVSGWTCIIYGQSRLGKSAWKTREANKARRLKQLQKK